MKKSTLKIENQYFQKLKIDIIENNNKIIYNENISTKFSYDINNIWNKKFNLIFKWMVLYRLKYYKYVFFDLLLNIFLISSFIITLINCINLNKNMEVFMKNNIGNITFRECLKNNLSKKLKYNCNNILKFNFLKTNFLISLKVVIFMVLIVLILKNLIYIMTKKKKGNINIFFTFTLFFSLLFMILELNLLNFIFLILINILLLLIVLKSKNIFKIVAIHYMDFELLIFLLIYNFLNIQNIFLNYYYFFIIISISGLLNYFVLNILVFVVNLMCIFKNKLFVSFNYLNWMNCFTKILVILNLVLYFFWKVNLKIIIILIIIIIIILNILLVLNILLYNKGLKRYFNILNDNKLLFNILNNKRENIVKFYINYLKKGSDYYIPCKNELINDKKWKMKKKLLKKNVIFVLVK